MAQTEQDKAAAKAAEEAKKAAEASPAGRQGNLDPDPTREDAPVPNEGTPAKPAAAGNASDVARRTDSGPNQMSTAGLTLAQRARVEGTPIQGNLAAPGQTGANEAVAAGDRFGGKYDEDGNVKESFKRAAAAAEKKRTGK